jgi:hypothetical protein
MAKAKGINANGKSRLAPHLWTATVEQAAHRPAVKKLAAAEKHMSAFHSG